MWVITAGSVMHMIIAVVLIVIVYAGWGQPQEIGVVRLGAVVEGSPAEQAGLQVDDIITTVNGTAVTVADDWRKQLAAATPGTEMKLGVVRDGQPIEIVATLIQNPSTDVQRGYLGVSPFSEDLVQLSVIDALTEGPKDLVTGVGQAITGVAKVINPVNVWGHLTGTNSDVSSRPGTIVGATRISDDVGEYAGWAGMLFLFASLNVSVGVFNMFPLLPLDGGHAAIATYERIRSRRGKRYYADVNKLMPVAAACIALLAFMFLTGLYLDIAKG